MTAKHSLPAELTVYHVATLRSAMLGWLGKRSKAKRAARAAGPLEVDASAVAEVDGSGVQLLLSLRAALQARGRELALVGASRPLVRACTTLGLADLVATAGASA